jgi:PAS domain-containing protein
MAPRRKAGAPLALPLSPNLPDVRGEHLRLLETHVPVLTWTTDAALRITSSGGALLDVLGVDPIRVRGLTLAEYFRTEDENFLPISVHRRALAGASDSYEVHDNGRTYRAFVEPLPGGLQLGAGTLALHRLARELRVGTAELRRTLLDERL